MKAADHNWLCVIIEFGDLQQGAPRSIVVRNTPNRRVFLPDDATVLIDDETCYLYPV